MLKLRYLKEILFLSTFLIISVVFLASGLYLKNNITQALANKNNALSSERMINLSNSIIKEYQVVFKKTNRLNNFITSNPDSSTAEIEYFIKTTLMPRDLSAFFNNKNNAFIKAYVVACDDIVSLVHPSELKQNSAIEYFTDSASEYYRRLAQNNPNDVIVQGPILSVKNHDSLIFNRQAVFIDDKYWGYVGIVVDFSKFLECVKLNVEDNLFVYAIRSSVNKGSSDFIWGDNSLFKYRDKSTKQKSLFVGKQRWDLSLKIKQEIDTQSYIATFIFIFALLYLICLSLGLVLVNYIIKHKETKLVDYLTNALNHETFIQLVQNELKNYQEHALVCVELVHFKQVNNTFGYRVGDEILLNITKRIESVIGYNDRVCRIGAEILIFLKNIQTVIDVERICFDIQDKINAPLYVQNYSVRQKCVIVSANTIESGHDFWTLVRHLNEDLDKHRHEEEAKNTPYNEVEEQEPPRSCPLS